MACVKSSTICMASTRQTFITKLQICTNLLTKVIYVVIYAKSVYMYLIYRSLFAFINYHVYSSRLTIYFKFEIIVKSKKYIFKNLLSVKKCSISTTCVWDPWAIERAVLGDYTAFGPGGFVALFVASVGRNVAVNLTMGQWDNCGLAPGEMLRKCSPGQRTAHRELLNKNKSLLKDTGLKRGCWPFLTAYS